MTRIKICGVTEIDNALACAEMGADLIGLNFYRPSPRSVTTEQGRAVADALRDAFGARCPVLVGVFVNEDAATIRQVVDFVGLDAAHLALDDGGVVGHPRPQPNRAQATSAAATRSAEATNT